MSLHDACIILDGPEDDGKQLFVQLEAFRYMMKHPLLNLYHD